MKKIPPMVAAAVMGKCEQFVRIGLQRGLLPFGVAVKAKEGRNHRYNYYISPKAFIEYTGASEEMIKAEADRLGVDLG